MEDENQLVSVGEVRDCGNREDIPLSIFTEAAIDDSAIKFDALGPIVLNIDGSMGRINNWSAMSDVEQKQAFRLISKRNKKRVLEIQDRRKSSNVKKAENSDSTVPEFQLPRINSADIKSTDGIRIVCISDTHNKHWDLPPLPNGDVLVHAGDFCSTGSKEEVTSFLLWLEGQNFGHKVFVAGNHDTALDRDYYSRPVGGGAERFGHVLESGVSAFETSQQCLELVQIACTKQTNYLQDNAVNLSFPYEQHETSHVEERVVRVYGSPWQPEFCDWAFNLPPDGPEMRAVWSRIPTECDVLVTHTPPRGLGDLSGDGTECGCVALRRELRGREPPPRLHVFGHVHEGYGVWFDGRTLFVNASTCTGDYRPSNPPVTIFLPHDKSLPASVVVP